MSNDQRKIVIEKFNKEHEGLLKNFEKWISSRDLPRDMNQIVLIRYLRVCDYDIEKAKELLQLNMNIRSKNASMFSDRDIRSKALQKTVNTVQVCTLPKLTSENLRVTIFRLINTDSKNYNTIDAVKFIFMVQDLIHTMLNDGIIADGEVCIFDSKDFSIWHFLNLASNVSTVRLFMRYVQEAVPHRLIQNHFVNCSPILTKIIALIRPFMKKELFDTFHFHTGGFESLHKEVPKECLPVEYDGTIGSLDKYYDDFLRQIDEARDYLCDDRKWGLEK